MRHFFVDEAGDLTLFDKQGRSMLGRDGVSRCFMVGVAEIRDPASVERRKTALAFHAKDDLPEVRWRVYERLRRLDIKVAVALRRKVVLEAQARVMFQKTGRKLRPDDVYDALVTQLFIGRFQNDAKNHIAFAIRKKARRDAALTHAIDRARLAQACTTQCDLVSELPSGAAGLQVVDYYLWAVQRLFERAEGRFFAGIAKQVEYVWDLDDTRDGAGGVRYDGQGLVLTPERMLPLAPARFEESLEHPA
jgi:hypothetical protein